MLRSPARIGYPDQALARSRAAFTLAQERPHPYSEAYALHMALRLHGFRREVSVVREQAAAVLALSRPGD